MQKKNSLNRQLFGFKQRLSEIQKMGIRVPDSGFLFQILMGIRNWNPESRSVYSGTGIRNPELGTRFEFQVFEFPFPERYWYHVWDKAREMKEMGLVDGAIV